MGQMRSVCPAGASCRWGGSELGLVYDNDRHDNPAAEIS